MKKVFIALMVFFANYAQAQAPIITSVTNLNNECWIHVTAPVNNLGGVNYYQYSLDNGTTWVSTSPLATESPVKISGLTNCTSYSVKIRANQLFGNSVASSEATVQPKASSLNISNNFTLRAAAQPYSWNSVAYGNGLFVAVSSSGWGNRVMTSPDGITWTSQFTPSDQPWKTVAYGNGTFVALANGNTGVAMTSTDGITWTEQYVGYYCEWESVTFGGGLFVAVASSGYPQVMYSSDGIVWNQSNAAGNEAWKSVTYGDGKFVAVAENTYGYGSMTSTDGINWTGNSGIFNSWKSVTYGAGKFVAVSDNGVNRLMTSTDGASWTEVTSGVAGIGYWTSVTYGNGIFVAVAQYYNNKVIWSLDGVTWFSKDPPGNEYWQSVTYGNGKFVAVASMGSFPGQVMSNPMSFTSAPDAPVITAAASNGTNTNVYFNPPSNSGSASITYYEYSTNNGTTWVNPTTPINSSPFTISGLSSGAVRLRAVSPEGSSCPSTQVQLSFAPGAPTIDSTDGINGGALVYFTPPISNGGAEISNYEYSIDNGATWVTPSPAVTTSPLTFTGLLTNCTTGSVKIRAVNIAGAGTSSSSSSVYPTASQFTLGTFVQRTSLSGSFNSLVYGNGTFVAVGNAGAVMTSNNGVNWTLRTAANSSDWRAIAYGNGIFVAVASSGTPGQLVMTSPDGITWTAQTAPSTRTWTSIAFGNGMFIAVSEGTGLGVSAKTAMVSSNGINWTMTMDGQNMNWNKIIYGQGKFMVFPNGGTLCKTTTDGINWTSTNFSTWGLFYTADGLYANDKFVIVGSGPNVSGVKSSIMYSSDGIDWSYTSSPAGYTDWSVTSIGYGNGLFISIPNANQSLAQYPIFKSTNGIDWVQASTVTNNGLGDSWKTLAYANARFVTINNNSNATYGVMTSNVLTKATPTPVINSIRPYYSSCYVNFTTAFSLISEPATNYQYSINNGASWVAMNPATNTNPFKINGLTNGINYNIMIRSISIGGYSCPSNTVSVTPSMGVAASAPIIDSIKNMDNSATVFFSTPSNDGGSPITNYQYSVDSGATWITCSPASTVSPMSITGISNCSRYPIFIRAINITGPGANSNLVVAYPSHILIDVPSTWTYSSGPTITGTQNGNYYWRDIAYGNGKYVVVGAQGSIADKVLTSTDGLNWTKRTAAANISWTSLAFGNGVFVATSDNLNNGNVIMKSADGINWTISTAPFDFVYSVVFGYGKFVAIGWNQSQSKYVVCNSTDGITWTQVAAVTKNYSKLTYANGKFIAVGNLNNINGTSVGILMTSPDGITWTEQNNSSILNWGPSYITYGAGKYVAYGYLNSKLLYSTDGINWVQSPQANLWVTGISFGNGMFLIKGANNNQYSSIDGVNWTLNLLSTSSETSQMRFLNGKFFKLSGTQFYYSCPFCPENPTSLDVLSFAEGGAFETANYPAINTITTSGGNGLINFTAPTSDGGQPITNYEYSTDNGNTWVTPSPAVTTSPLVMPGVIVGDIRIRAVNRAGAGCSSNLITLSVCNTTTSNTNINICAYELPFTWNGNSYSTAGTYNVTLVNAGGCDSIATLNLTVSVPSSTSLSMTACDSYSWHGNTYTASGVYTWTGTNAAGCDSTVTLTLLIKNATSSTTNTSVCSIQLPYTWNGNNYNSAGNYTYTTTNSVGCDSIATLVLTVKNTSVSTTNISVCSNQLPYSWNGNSYNEAGNYTYTTTNAVQCDSVATLVLNVKNASSSTTNVTRCSNQLPYTWNGNIYSAAGTYHVTFTNSVGCDSIATLVLSVNPTSSSITTISNAGSYQWNGNTYTYSGTYTWTGTNAAGCDSVATLIYSNTSTNITNVCPYIGTNDVLIYTASVAGAPSYNWILPANTQLIAGQGTRSVQVKILNGFASQANKQIKVTPSGYAQQIIYLLAQTPVTPSPITAVGPDICTILGTTTPVTFSISKVPAATSYLWTAQNGTTTISHTNGTGLNDTTITVTFASNFSASAVTVAALNGCGVSGVRSIPITRNAPPTPGLISGTANTCEYIGSNGQAASYSVAAIASANSYAWTIPQGATNVTGQGTNSISFKYPAGYTGGSLSVTATNGCGTSSARSLNVSRLLPAMPSVMDVINTSACPSRRYSYTLTGMPPNATSILWTVPAGATLVSGQGSISIVVSYPNAVVSGNVTAKSISNCGVSSTRSTEVKLIACPAPGFAANKGVAVQNNPALEMNAYPNPSKSTFTVKVSSGVQSKVQVNVYDLQGRLLQTLQVASIDQFTIGNDWKVGVYMIEAIQGDKKITKRLVKY